MSSKLHEPGQALGDYLDEMLHLATSNAAAAPVAQTREVPVLPVQLPTPEIVDETAPAAVAADETASAQSGPPEPAVPVPGASDSAGLAFPLQCLMFRVGEHLLSVPLIQLSSVVSWSDALTRLPQSPDWLLGLIKVRDVNVRVVDSSRLLDIEAGAPQKPGHLLLLDDSGWAITCDQLEQVVNLEADEIQWKSGNHRRMVLGTIRDSLSTLVSPPGIVAELDSRARPADAE